MKLRGKFVGMRKPNCAPLIPWNAPEKPKYFKRPAINPGEFVIVDGKAVRTGTMVGKVVVVPPKRINQTAETTQPRPD